MGIQRRDILKAGLGLSALAGLPRAARAAVAFAPQPEGWRRFELVTQLSILKPEGKTQAWIPLPAVDAPLWFEPMGSTWTGNADARIDRDPKTGTELLHAEWREGETAPSVEVTSKFATRDRAVDLAKPAPASLLSDADRKLYTAPTALIPTDGIVKTTAEKITAGKRGEVAKARAIYEWIVDNTFRNPETRGCGLGNVAFMLETGNLGGKCADINALYVGLCRAIGLPARDIYGIRVAPSKFGYKSLGAGSANVTKAQHCRAEVYLDGHGWVPVDPADVRKVVLEEPPGNLPVHDEKVEAARKTLFGAWETNWAAYNTGHDVPLPGSSEGGVDFLMYPQAETAGSRLDPLDPDGFKYTITAKELPA